MNEQTYTDRPTLERWNELVSAAAGMPKVAAGYYIGANATVRVSLGFRPKAVLIIGDSGYDFPGGTRSLLVVDYYLNPTTRIGMAYCTADGFRIENVPNNYPMLTVSGVTYAYLAIG